MRKLLSQRPRPYYIYAPDYRKNSAGIRLLHMLCDALIRSGYEAYVTAKVLAPEFMTPRLTNDVVEAHKQQGVEPIAIYPEVVDGNPLGANIVVRYLLNRPGYLQGNGVYSDTDLLIAFSQELLLEGMSEDRVLFLPTIDLSVFKLSSDKEKRIPGKVCFYRGRNRDFEIDSSLLPKDAVEITSSWPETWAELADLFQQCEFFYCCGSSALAVEATLCGCLTVVIVSEDAPKIAITETKSYGVAWGTDKAELSRAKKTLPFVHEVWNTHRAEFWPALDRFIKLSQTFAQERVERLKLTGNAEVSQWLDRRVLATAQANALQAIELNKSKNKLRCSVIVANFDHNEQSVFDTQNHILTAQKGLTALSISPLQIVDKAKFIYQLNEWLTKTTDDWLLVLSAGEKLTSSGLLMAQIELMQNPKLSAISFDEVYRQEDGSLGAAFRPSGNLDYLLSFPAGMSRHWLFNRKALLDIGGFNPELPDAFELDAILRLINKGGLECIGHIPEPLVIAPPPVLANVEDERKAILSHLAERGYTNAELHAPNPGRYQIRYNHPGQPVVSVMLAAGSNLAKLQHCVEGLLGNTDYQNFEILFIQQPDSGVEVKEWLAGLAAMQEAKLRVFVSNETTLAQQYNEVGQHAIGDYLLFLSADTGIVSQHWLDEMLNHAQRGEVGIVGAKLLTPGGEIAHAGHILGLEGPVGAPFVGEPLDAPGYMQRLQVDQNLSSVSGDCLMVLRELFVQLEGFANGALADEYLSTDLCLRAREAGFLIVWTPHAQLMLDKPKATRPSAEQEDVMYERWLPQLARDPAYNPNFSLSMPGGFKLADTQISWRPLDSIRPAPVALVHPADLMGCGHYRVMQPFLAMKGEGLLDGAISTGLMHVTDLERYNPDTIVLQRQIGDARLEAMQRMQKFSRAVKVYELDDYLPNLPLKSVHRKDMPKDIVKSLRRGLSFVDRFVVSTQAMAEAFAGMHGEIVVCENRLPTSWWDGLQTKRRQGKKPRVGWAGGSSHTGDLELIADVVRDLADEVEWVFFGMCPDALKPYVHEFHGGVAIEQYPAKLASLNLDLGLAPLEHNLFNECKSNLRQLEYGACGIPIICTDIRPYQDGLNAGLPVTLVKNRYKDWVEAIRMHINDLDATAKMADELHAKVKADWMLQGVHLERWRDAWLGK